jgi:hypothetical protein
MSGGSRLAAGATKENASRLSDPLLRLLFRDSWKGEYLNVIGVETPAGGESPFDALIEFYRAFNAGGLNGLPLIGQKGMRRAWTIP